MADVQFLDFVRGPFLKFAILFFFLGISYRIIRILVKGIPKDKAKPRGNVPLNIIKMPILKPIYEWQFPDVFSKKAIIYIAGFTFHIGFLGVTFLIPQHAFLWKEIIGIEPIYFSGMLAHILAYATVLSLIILWLARIFDPVLRLLTGIDEHIANFLILATIATGILATQWVGGSTYITMLSIHILFASILIIYIPFSRLAHFIDYFFATAFYGRDVGKKGVSM
ncbi:MAG: hypothetical protein GXO22_03780 [Aquificae bacterium]|nr:hypothetical protein [Aquificota bacterium]